MALHFATLLYVLCAAVLVLVSLATQPPDAARVEPLTIRRYRDAAVPRPSGAAAIAISAVLVALVSAAWLFFS